VCFSISVQNLIKELSNPSQSSFVLLLQQCFNINQLCFNFKLYNLLIVFMFHVLTQKSSIINSIYPEQDFFPYRCFMLDISALGVLAGHQKGVMDNSF